MLYLILKHSHSILRWIFLLILLYTIIRSLLAVIRNSPYTRQYQKVSLIVMIVSHIQFLLGFGLFLISPKVIFSAESLSNSMLRFFLLEHTLLMLTAIVLITMGYSRTKLTEAPQKKHRRTLSYFGISLVVILAAIPWPWRALAAAWF